MLQSLAGSTRLVVIPAADVLALAIIASGQDRNALRKQSGNAIGEVYHTSNHLTVTAFFDEQENICRARIEHENKARMTDGEVNSVLDEIAPKSERGSYKMGTFLNIICLPDNDCAGVSEDYERLAITKIGSTNEYRYVSIVYHSAECKQLDGEKKD